MIQIDWSLGVSAALFLATLFALNQLLFRPLFRVLEERKAKTSDLFEKAEEHRDHHEELLHRCEQRIKEEKQAGYRLSEQVRNQALKERQVKLNETRAASESLLNQAKGKLARELETARGKLRGEAGEIADLISSRVLKGN